MTRVDAFPLQVRLYGLLGLLGIVVFMTSLIVLHRVSNDIDWVRDYVSNLANEPYGWLFVGGGFVHGLGNLAVSLGLRRALQPERLRTWAVVLLGLAAVGILVATLFPIDPPGQGRSITGRIHLAAASATFLLELAALFVFSVVFGRQHRWQRHRAVSMALSVTAAIALTVFFLAILVDMARGLAERTALLAFLLWEIWICFQLIRPAGKLGAGQIKTETESP